MNNNISLAEMANNADYAAMSYGELLNTKIAYTYALGIKINPLLKTKRLEEMARFTKIYVTVMNGYDATRTEIHSLLEDEGLKENHMFSSPAYKEDQTSDVVPSNEEKDNSVSEETVLALPEHTNNTDDVEESVSEEAVSETESKEDEAVGENPTVSSPEEEKPVTASGQDEEVENPVEETSADDEDTPGTQSPTYANANSPSSIEKAIELSKTRPLPENINPNSSYYIINNYDIKDDGTLEYGGKVGRNLSNENLEEFRSASEKYVTLFLKEKVLISFDDCVVSTHGKNGLSVCLYHFLDENGEGEEDKYISDDEKTRLRKRYNLMKRAIKEAKDYSFSDGTSLKKPFYDRYTFHWHLKWIDLRGDRQRFDADVDTLTELMPAFETYAKYYGAESYVYSKDNCVAAMYGDTIFLVLFNIPVEKKKRKTTKRERVAKKEKVTKKSAPVVKDDTVTKEPEVEVTPSPSQSVRDLILKAVEMTKTLPVSNGTDINSPYFVQNCYCITNNGDLILTGKPFGSNVDGDGLDKYRKTHRKYAKTMKASATVSTDDYTAFIWNQGNNLTVFYYHTQDKKEAA